MKRDKINVYFVLYKLNMIDSYDVLVKKNVFLFIYLYYIISIYNVCKYKDILNLN